MTNKLPVRIDYLKNGYDVSFLKNKKLHNEEGPALISYDNEGEIIKEIYSIKGKVYKGIMYNPDDMPGIRVEMLFQKEYIKKTSFNPDKLLVELYGISDGICNGSCSKSDECFCFNTISHRLDGPAVIYYGSSLCKLYCINGYKIGKNFYKVSLLVRIAKRLFLKPLKIKYKIILNRVSKENYAVSDDISKSIMGYFFKLSTTQ